jgi:H2-forming N5,N10-methylenetetrahydromethanopterin dehydrogenase-like enzyme
MYILCYPHGQCQQNAHLDLVKSRGVSVTQADFSSEWSSLAAVCSVLFTSAVSDTNTVLRTLVVPSLYTQSNDMSETATHTQYK